MKNFQTALAMYTSDNGALPQGLDSPLGCDYVGGLHTILVGGGYISSIPCEKWDGGNSSAQYRFCSLNMGNTADGGCVRDANPDTYAIRFKLENAYMCATAQGIEPAVSLSGAMRCIQK